MIKPLDDRVVVRILPEPPDGCPVVRIAFKDEPQHFGEVVAVGPGRRMKGGLRRRVCVSPGDRVWYGRFWDVERDGLRMIQEADIIGIVVEQQTA